MILIRADNETAPKTFMSLFSELTALWLKFGKVLASFLSLVQDVGKVLKEPSLTVYGRQDRNSAVRVKCIVI